MILAAKWCGTQGNGDGRAWKQKSGPAGTRTPTKRRGPEGCDMAKSSTCQQCLTVTDTATATSTGIVRCLESKYALHSQAPLVVRLMDGILNCYRQQTN